MIFLILGFYSPLKKKLRRDDTQHLFHAIQKDNPHEQDKTSKDRESSKQCATLISLSVQ